MSDAALQALGFTRYSTFAEIKTEEQFRAFLKALDEDRAAEVERLRLDAARWQELRKSIDFLMIVDSTGDAPWPVIDGWVVVEDPIEMDDQIDQVIRARSEAGGTTGG